MNEFERANKRVVSYGIDIMIDNDADTEELENIIADALENNGIDVYCVAFKDDVTEYYDTIL